MNSARRASPWSSSQSAYTSRWASSSGSSITARSRAASSDTSILLQPVAETFPQRRQPLRTELVAEHFQPPQPAQMGRPDQGEGGAVGDGVAAHVEPAEP